MILDYHRQAVQLCFSFLTISLPFLCDFCKKEVLLSIFQLLLHLYLTSHSDRCVGFCIFSHVQKEITQCCLCILGYVRCHSDSGQDPNRTDFSFFVSEMNAILQVNQPDLLDFVVNVLSIEDPKQRVLRFRKVLERAKKERAEKGVPVHIQ